MIVDGILYPLRKLERTTSVTDGSYLLPTPTASDYGTGGNGVRKGKQKQVISLGTMARKNLWPTPRATDGTKGSPNQRGSKGDLTLPSAAAQSAGGGKLNPQFAEWLMGYPTEWTVSEPWAMRSSPRKRVKRSRS